MVREREQIKTGNKNGRGVSRKNESTFEVQHFPPLSGSGDTHYSEGRVTAVVEGPLVLVAGKVLVAEGRKGTIRKVSPEKFEYLYTEMPNLVQAFRASRGVNALRDGVEQLSNLGHRFLSGEISRSDFAKIAKRFTTGRLAYVDEPVRRLFAMESETSVVLGESMQPRNVLFEVPTLSLGFLADGTPESSMAPVVLRKFSDVEGEQRRLVPIADYIRTNGDRYLTEKRLIEIGEAGEVPYYRIYEVGAPLSDESKVFFEWTEFDFAAHYLSECAKTIQRKNNQGWISADDFLALIKIGNLFTGRVINEDRFLQLGSELCRTGKIRTRKQEKPRPYLEINHEKTGGFDKVADELSLGLEDSGLFIAISTSSYEAMVGFAKEKRSDLKKISAFLDSLNQEIVNSNLPPIVANMLRFQVAKSLDFALSQFSFKISGQKSIIPSDELQVTYSVGEPDGSFLEEIGKKIGQINPFNDIYLNAASIGELKKIREDLAIYRLNLVGSIASILLNAYPELKRYVEKGRKNDQAGETEAISNYQRNHPNSPSFLKPMFLFSVALARVQKYGKEDNLYNDFMRSAVGNMEPFTTKAENELLTGELVKERYTLIIQNMRNAFNFWKK